MHFFSSFLIQHCAYCALLCSCGVFLFVFFHCISLHHHSMTRSMKPSRQVQSSFFSPLLCFYFTSSTTQTMFFQLHMVVYFFFLFRSIFHFFLYSTQCKSNAICRVRSEELSEILLHGKFSTITSLMPAASCCAAISKISLALRLSFGR